MTKYNKYVIIVLRKGKKQLDPNEREDKTMNKKYLVVTYTYDRYGNIGDEWIALATDDRQEAIARAFYEEDTCYDRRYFVELREVEEIVDTDEDGETVNYNYSTIDYHMEWEKTKLLVRSKLFNMKAVCEVAGVSYGSWRQFKNGNQGLSNKVYEAIVRVMNNA